MLCFWRTLMLKLQFNEHSIFSHIYMSKGLFMNSIAYVVHNSKFSYCTSSRININLIHRCIIYDFLFFSLIQSTEHLTTAVNHGDSARTSLASSRESSTSAQGSLPFRWELNYFLNAFLLHKINKSNSVLISIRQSIKISEQFLCENLALIKGQHQKTFSIHP